MEAHASAWPVILALGVWHGVNPGMGWLFAVALGLQRRRAGAVWHALPPLALGHAGAIAATLGIAAAIGMVMPLATVRWVTAAVLVGAGLYRLWRRHSHGMYVGMRVGRGTLALWSLLVASAHGAGLMVVPFVLRDAAVVPTGHVMHVASMMPAGAPGALAATAVHSAGYLLATGAIAVIVYQKVGLRFLRTMWINLDLVWAVALVATGLVTPLL